MRDTIIQDFQMEEIEVLFSLAEALVFLKQTPEALGALVQALKTCKAIGDFCKQAHCFIQIGMCYMRQGKVCIGFLLRPQHQPCEAGS